MTEQKQPITSSKNIEEQEKLKAKYEAESQEKQQKILDLENKITKKNDEIFEKDKTIDRLASERDDWKKEVHSARKIQSETKQAKETTDFLSQFKKLQAKKGLRWDEDQQTWI